MHEIAIAQEIVAQVLATCPTGGVRRVIVKVGKLALVLPDALRFGFDTIIAETVLAGAVLDIVEVPGRGRCVACHAEIAMDRPFALCGCGGSQFDWLAGEELVLSAIEVM